MGSIPLPALDLRPVQQSDPLGDVSKLMALKSMMGQQQLQQGDIQLQQQQLADQHAMTAAFKDWDPKSQSYDDLAQSVVKNGGSANAAMQVTQHGLQMQQGIQTLTKDQRDNFILAHKQVGDALEPLVDPNLVPDDQLHDKAVATVNALAKSGIMDSQTAQQSLQKIQTLADPTQLRSLIDQTAKTSMGAAAVANQAKTQAETSASNAKAALDQAQTWLETNKANVIKAYQQNPQQLLSQIDQIAPPTGPNAGLNARTKSMVQFALGNGDVDGAKSALKQAADQVGGVEKDVQEQTNPAIMAAKLHLATAEKAAEQTIADGDPVAAGKLLHDGVVAPSQIISARKPEFAQKAFDAAAGYGDGWNAQKAEADYKVASSPANLAFFGSAKSLTDKGGTLDQLAAAAKDIPANQFPIFNSVADAVKAATGSGPIAKYASLALGVADDYSKVMGGGQGSDTSRTQAMNLVAGKQSPEQRAASIEGIRGAVGSQTGSRIGNNAVLQRMYGGSVPQEKQQAQPSGPPAGATHTAMGSDGKKHYTNAQGQDLGVVPQ